MGLSRGRPTALQPGASCQPAGKPLKRRSKRAIFTSFESLERLRAGLLPSAPGSMAATVGGRRSLKSKPPQCSA